MKKTLGAFLFCILLLGICAPVDAFQFSGLPAPTGPTLEQGKFLDSLIPSDRFQFKVENEPAPPLNNSVPEKQIEEKVLNGLIGSNGENSASPENGENEKGEGSVLTGENGAGGENGESADSRAPAPTTGSAVQIQDAFLEALVLDGIKNVKPEGENSQEDEENEGEFRANAVLQDSNLKKLLNINKNLNFDLDRNTGSANENTAATARKEIPESLSQVMMSIHDATPFEYDTREILSRPFFYCTPMIDFWDVRTDYTFLSPFEQRRMIFSPWLRRQNQQAVFMDDISPQIVDYLERVRSDGKTLRIMRDSPMNSLITLDFSTSSDSDRLRGGPYVGFPDGGGSGNYYARLIQSQVLFWTLLLTILFIMYWNRKVF